MKVGFIGHEDISYEAVIADFLYEAIDTELKGGAKTFYVGLFGDFNFLARLYILNKKQEYPYIKIVGVVSESDIFELETCKEDLDIIIFINGEKILYNQNRAKCYKTIVDICDKLICFVSNRLPVSYKGYHYARTINKPIINLNNHFKDEFCD